MENNAEAIAINSMLDKIHGKIVMYYYKLMEIDGSVNPDKIKILYWVLKKWVKPSSITSINSMNNTDQKLE